MRQVSTEEYRRAIERYFPNNTDANDVLRESALYLLDRPGYTDELGRIGQHLHKQGLSPRALGLAPLQQILGNYDVFKVGAPVQRYTRLLVHALPGHLFNDRQPSPAAKEHQQQHSCASCHKRELPADDKAQVFQEPKRHQQTAICPSIVKAEPQSITAVQQAIPPPAAADTTIRAGIALSAALAAAGAGDQQAAAVAHVQQQVTVTSSSRDTERMRLMSSMFEFGTAMVKAGAAPDKVMQLLDEARSLVVSSSNGAANSHGVSNGYRNLGQ